MNRRKKEVLGGKEAGGMQGEEGEGGRETGRIGLKRNPGKTEVR